MGDIDALLHSVDLPHQKCSSLLDTMWMFRLITFAILAGASFAQNSPTVSTNSGRIRGHHLVSYNGNQYEAYEGIPYALPPTGERRFEPPQPVSSWPGELAATKKSNSCLQRLRSSVGNGQYVIGDEDCLYLNVYAPIRKSNESLPVLFWIHGGAFQYGAGTRAGPKYLMDYNVILVTVNYRLGFLGFLSTEDATVSGNMGLKDQSVAIKWVYDNIEYFGGDSKRVTLIGLSAGGASVHYHYLSPWSKGLFHSGISFSGTAFNSWTQTENSKEKAIKMAEHVNCPTNDVRNMVNCFKRVSATDLVNATALFMPWELNPFTPFGPVVEWFGEQPFINRPPIDIINSGDAYDVPWITGVTSEEGLYPVAEFGLNSKIMEQLDKNWETIAPLLLDYEYTIPKYKHAEVARVVREHYLGNKTINRESLLNLTHLVGDRLFLAAAADAAITQARVNLNPVYFYYYNYRAHQSISDDLSYSKENLGVCHGDDINLILENTHISPSTPLDVEMHKDLIKFCVTVARKGVPKFGPKWLNVRRNQGVFDYLQIIGPGNFKMRTDSNFAQRKFWHTIDFDENRETIKPYQSLSTIHVAYITLILTCTILHYANIPPL